MVATAKKLLGVGLYTPAEAAMYARIPTQTLNRWMFGDARGDAVLTPRMSDEKIINFLEFVEAMSIRAIVTNRRVPLHKVRQAIDLCSRKYKIKHPFARRHTTYLLGDDLVIKLPEHDDIVLISGREANQHLMKEIVEVHLQDLSWGADGLARAYDAYHWRDRRITMDPEIRFGEPIIHGAGYTARTLYEAISIEGNVPAAAKAYGVDEQDIMAAAGYFDYLGKRAG